jgi:hypothetical protein
MLLANRCKALAPGLFSKQISPEYFIVTAATSSLAAKLLAQKNIELAESLSDYGK